MDFKPRKPVEWYSIRQLLKTFIKVMSSKILGDFIDKREIQAALDQNKHQPFNYDDGREEMWIDYIADLGDGFDATYTMATLLAKPELKIAGQNTQQGDILIMGGDQVYPAAHREAYNDRLKGPYKSAFPFDMEDPEGKKAPDLFAIPGNHDWYDGLSNFLKIFCQKRAIGNWRTKQQRSYFALKLPHKVWILGVDVHLNSDIDYNQVLYFTDILEKEMEPGSKVILCTAEPSWIYSTSTKARVNNNLAYFENKIASLKDQKGHPKASQILTLTGDIHHYNRYETAEKSIKITAGGGGAFTHGTHHLPPSIEDTFGQTLHLKKRFPTAKQSKKLLFKNLYFGFNNLEMGISLGIVYALISWLCFVHIPFNNASSFGDFLKIIPFHPSIFILLALVVIGLRFFTENKPYHPKFRHAFPYQGFSFMHGIVQTIMILLSYHFAFKMNPFSGTENAISSLLFVLGSTFLSGFLLGSLIFGLYLITANLLLRNHHNDAFASLKSTHYKNFIRMHLTKHALTIYPVGVKSISQWKIDEDKDGNPIFTPNKTPSCQAIEDPISITLS